MAHVTNHETIDLDPTTPEGVRYWQHRRAIEERRETHLDDLAEVREAISELASLVWLALASIPRSQHDHHDEDSVQQILAGMRRALDLQRRIGGGS